MALNRTLNRSVSWFSRLWNEIDGPSPPNSVVVRPLDWVQFDTVWLWDWWEMGVTLHLGSGFTASTSNNRQLRPVSSLLTPRSGHTTSADGPWGHSSCSAGEGEGGFQPGPRSAGLVSDAGSETGAIYPVISLVKSVVELSSAHPEALPGHVLEASLNSFK